MLPQRLLPPETISACVEEEKTAHAFQSLKRTGPVTVDIDSSPSPPKRMRAASAAAPNPSPPNATLPGLLQQDEDQVEESDDLMPVVGEGFEEDEEDMDTHIPWHRSTFVDFSSCNGLVCQCHLSKMVLFPLLISTCFWPQSTFNWPCAQRTPGVDGKYLCRKGNDFAGLRACEGHFLHFDNGVMKTWSVGQVASRAERQEVILFCLKPFSEVDPSLQDFVGGARQVKYVCPLPS